MPTTIVGPGPFSEPPRASTPFTVSKSRAVSKSQMIFPVSVA